MNQPLSFLLLFRESPLRQDISLPYEHNKTTSHSSSTHNHKVSISFHTSHTVCKTIMHYYYHFKQCISLNGTEISVRHPQYPKLPCKWSTVSLPSIRQNPVNIQVLTTKVRESKSDKIKSFRNNCSLNPSEDQLDSLLQTNLPRFSQNANLLFLKIHNYS